MPEHPANWINRVRGVPTGDRIVNVDAWGDDESSQGDGASTSGRSAEATPNTGRAQLTEGDMRRLLTASLAAPQDAQGRGPATLHSICLGCLGTFLEDFLEAGPGAGECLSPMEKAAMIAVARRRGLLNDSSLCLLADEEFTYLEVSHSAITSAGLLHVLRMLPCLRHLSLLGIELSKQLLADLSQCCPLLETLRLGGNQSSGAVKGVWIALQRLVPCISVPASGQAVDWDWEQAPQLGQVEASQLPELRFLVWPDASQQQISSLLQRCPRLEINPGPKRFSSLLPGRRLPPEADMWRPLDSSAVAAVSQLWWAGLCGSSGGGPSGAPPASARSQLAPGGLSIADRFRMAYQERSERQALKAERNRKQAFRRYVRQNPSVQLIWMAESGVPLAGRTRVRR